MSQIAPTAYTRIFVPLDGSGLATKAVPYAQSLALALGIPVVLGRAVELDLTVPTVEGAYLTQQVYEQILEGELGIAKDYLAPIASTLVRNGVETSVVVEQAHAATFILEHGEQPGTLVVMSTHGRSGIERFVFGSVTEQVIRAGGVTVLVIPALAPERPALRSALVPLDGSRRSERVLPVLLPIARALELEVMLLHVLTDASPSTLGEAAADAYLTHVKERLQASGVADVRWRIRTGLAGPAIREVTTDLDIDLVAMATHGRGTLARWWYGSVTDYVLHTTRVPMLVVPAGEKETE